MLTRKIKMNRNRKPAIVLTLFGAVFSFLSVNVIADGHATEILIDQAIQGEHRSAENKARDIYRHPKETLMFFGLEAEMNVLEILPGGGWYTEVLAPVLQDKGLLTVAGYSETAASEYQRNSHISYKNYLNSKPDIYRQVKLDVFSGNGYLGAIASDSQDMVVSFRSVHNWIRAGEMEEAFRAFNRVLKKGGVLGVVQHRAAEGTDAKDTAQKGYVPESYVIKVAESMGFELDSKSEINANPKDTKDYARGVWTLPPGYREKDKDKAKYTAIGESDRMTLRFIKL